jgi:heptosyltransferase-2
MRTALLARLARIPERVGFAGGAASLLYTVRVASGEKGFLRREADLAAALGASASAMRLVPRDEWVSAARAALGPVAARRIAAVCLGSEWATKIWPARHVADLVRRIAALGLQPVLLGGPRERDLAREVGAAAPCIDTTGNAVSEALAILSLSALAVGGDTGLVHAARALGVPTVAVFGPTPPDVHLFGPRERAVSLRLSCSPCTVHGSARCPLGHHRCLDDLGAEQVALACREVLA